MSTIGRMPKHTYLQMHSDGLEIVGGAELQMHLKSNGSTYLRGR